MGQCEDNALLSDDAAPLFWVVKKRQPDQSFDPSTQPYTLRFGASGRASLSQRKIPLTELQVTEVPERCRVLQLPVNSKVPLQAIGSWQRRNPTIRCRVRRAGGDAESWSEGGNFRNDMTPCKFVAVSKNNKKSCGRVALTTFVPLTSPP